ncbi:MAG: hypothetical protein ACE14M_01525 [Terriglobales bacterium]
MRLENHVGVAVFVGIAVLMVFVYPLTVGPPAPQQRQMALATLLACALAAFLMLFPAVVSAPVHYVGSRFDADPPDRLALICSRLC